MSILRNDKVPCHYFCNVHVHFKQVPSRMSNLGNNFVMSFIFIRLAVGSVNVDFKKWSCCHVGFKGQEPSKVGPAHNSQV